MFWKSKNEKRIESLEEKIKILSTEIGIVRGHSRVVCSKYQNKDTDPLWPEYIGVSFAIEAILKHLNMETNIIPFNDTHVVLKSKD